MKKHPNWGVILAVALVSSMVCQGQTVGRVYPNAGPVLTVTGTVYDSAGAPAPGVVVSMVPPAIGQNEPIKSDASGKYTLQWQVPSMARGRAGAAPVFSLMARDLEHNFVASQAIDETTTNLELHLKPGLTISAKVEDANGKPITNATGSLIIYSPSGMAGSIDRLPVSADEAGRIQFAALPQGFRYTESIRAPGYGTPRPTSIQEADTQTTRLDLPTVVLPSANLKLAGQVLGADGQPVAAARVFVSGQGQPATNIQSDASGHFALNVCEGTVIVTVSVAGATGNARAVGGDTNVVVRLNDVAAANANGISIINGAPARTGQVITGTVFDPSGAPIPGVALRVMPASGLNQEFKSETGGKFAISWLPVQGGGGGGRGAAAPAYEYSLVGSDLEHNLAAITSIDEKTTNMDLHLQAGLTISGKVQDPSGAPVKNATIQLSMMAGRGSGPVGRQPVTADAQGAFSIGALPQGQRYMVTVTATGYGRANGQAQPEQTKTASLQLPPFTLKPANLKLEGKVVDASDNPVSGARVILNGADQLNDNVTSDSAGHFVFNHVCEGTVSVLALNSGINGGGGVQGNIRAQGGDLNVVVKLGANQGVAGPAVRQAPPRMSSPKEQAWTWTALGHWPQRHRTVVMILLCVQLTVCLAGAGVFLWLTRARPG